MPHGSEGYGLGPCSVVRCRVGAMAREPTIEDVGRGMALVTELAEKDGLAHDKAVDYFCLVALNLNEFVYLD